MRPYLAVILDSFHEALASRVLWILLALSTLLLAALVPLGFIEQAGFVLRDEDLLNRQRLIERLVAQGKSKDFSPGRRIWEVLDTLTQSSLAAKPANPFETRGRNDRLLEALQTAIDKRDLFREADWAQVTLPAAARELSARGLENLADDEIARFNRLAIEAAFPGEIAPIAPKQIQLAYFNWELGLPLPVEPEQLFPAVNQLVVATLGTLLGVAGVFVAVLVTASMIPQTFEAGSVDLLLSKPISRSWLYLAKFFGGCAFIGINAAYLIGGLWLVLGLRFGLWNERLLWAIPLYLFLFAIYYGVSSLAGLVWRNAIVSVVLAVAFWFVCWSLGTANSLVEALSLDPRRLVHIVPAGETLIAASQSEVLRWDELRDDWQPIFTPSSGNQSPFMFRQPLVGPVYNPPRERILAFRKSAAGFAPLREANRLLIGKRSDDWRRIEGVTVPDGAFELFIGRRGDVLVAAPTGIYRLEGDSEDRQEDINVFGLHIPLPYKGGRFVRVGAEIQLRPLRSAAIDPQTDTIALFDGFRLVLFERDASGGFRQGNEQTFEHKQTGQVALGGGQVFLATPEGARRYSAQLTPLAPISTGIDSPAKVARVSPDGRYLAIVSQSARLWLYDIENSRPATLEVVGQGDITAVAFDGPKMFVADSVARVTVYDLDKHRRGQQWQGSMPLAEKIYRYALHPLYTVFPKPSQLNETVNHVLTPKDSPAGSLRLNDSQRDVPSRVDVWGPVWSNLAFLIVVLAAGCAYVYRKDF